LLRWRVVCKRGLTPELKAQEKPRVKPLGRYGYKRRRYKNSTAQVYM
jgi:hypothetical protein